MDDEEWVIDQPTSKDSRLSVSPCDVIIKLDVANGAKFSMPLPVPVCMKVIGAATTTIAELALNSTTTKQVAINRFIMPLLFRPSLVAKGLIIVTFSHIKSSNIAHCDLCLFRNFTLSTFNSLSNCSYNNSWPWPKFVTENLSIF